MTPERGILHSDLNCFYASVEILLNPSLRGKAVAVCGSAETRHGIVLAKSEKAKQAGVKTGMVNRAAKAICGDLIIVPPHYEQYLKYSELTRSIYARYTDLIEPFGMDECWLDVTDSRVFGDPLTIAEKIRTAVKEELGLTVSIGVSFNKVFAKLGSDMKKPDAVTQITPDNFKEKVWPLKADEMIYCGSATAKKLEMYGIKTIGDMANADVEFLKKRLGVNGIYLWSYANGNDNARVMHRDFVSPVKSVGHGITCVSDLENENEVWRVMLELSQDVGHRLRIHGLSARGVQVWVRGNDLFGAQFQCKLPEKTQLPAEIARAGFRLFRERYRRQTPVRAVCIRGIDLVPKNDAEQLCLFTDYEKKASEENLEAAIEDIRKRYGKTSITYASLLGNLKMPDDNRDLVRMPGVMYR